MLFSELGLTPTVLKAMAPLGHTNPTSVQVEAIPQALQGRDVLALAQTGSGKTLAFALPLVQNLQALATGQARRPRALVLVPTRELAIQVGETFHQLAQGLAQSIKVSVVFGGVSINPQLMALRGGTDILVATTGRLLDLIAHNGLSLSGIDTLVLDEADRMLDLGFSEELQKILPLLPRKRQSLFFSATFPVAVQALANTLLHEPVQINVASEAQERPAISQRAIEVDAARRTQLLRHLIQESGWQRVLVFVATKHAAEIVADKLRKASIHAEPFHGELSQGKRMQVLHDFKLDRLNVVVATDMAARGLDIPQLPVVVNYDLPRSADDYTHRIGRTGRAGQTGLAVSFISAATEAHFRLIEKRQHIHVDRERVSGFEPEEIASPVPNAPGGGIKGKRPNKKDKLRAAQADETQLPPS